MIIAFLWFLVALLIYMIFVMGEFSLSRFNSYVEDETGIKKNFFYRISNEISSNFRKYDYIFLLGKICTFVTLHLLFLYIYIKYNKNIIYYLYVYPIDNSEILLFFTSETIFILFVILFGNMIPHLIARSNIVKASLFSSFLIISFYYIFYPLILILNFSFKFFEKFFGLDFNKEEKDQNIQDELKYLIEESSKIGELEESEIDIIENALEFSDTTVKNIMTPRNKIIAIDIDDNLETIVKFICDEGYSRYPVYQGSVDNVIGILNVKDFFKNYVQNTDLNISNIIRKPVFVKEDEQIDNLLKIMKLQKVHIVIAKDQFNGTSGIITMEDIIEEIVGEINDEYDEEQRLIERISDFEFRVNPSISINDLNDLIPQPIPESDDYESLGGYLLYETGAIPDLNQEIENEFYKFTILKRTKRKIELVKIEIKIKENDN